MFDSFLSFGLYLVWKIYLLPPVPKENPPQDFKKSEKSFGGLSEAAEARMARPRVASQSLANEHAVEPSALRRHRSSPSWSALRTMSAHTHYFVAFSAASISAQD